MKLLRLVGGWLLHWARPESVLKTRAGRPRMFYKAQLDSAEVARQKLLAFYPHETQVYFVLGFLFGSDRLG